MYTKEQIDEFVAIESKSEVRGIELFRKLNYGTYAAEFVVFCNDRKRLEDARTWKPPAHDEDTEMHIRDE